MGIVMKMIGIFDVTRLQPEAYALVGMAAVLAAVVHAPLASILILLELTRNPGLVLPAMLAAIIATGVARLIFTDSIYTLTLRRRGIQIGNTADTTLLHRLVVEQVDLEPAVLIHPNDPFQRILDLMSRVNTADFVVVNDRGAYLGMVVAEDIKTALMEREAMPLLVVEELLRAQIPVIRNSDDLSSTMDCFALRRQPPPRRAGAGPHPDHWPHQPLWSHAPLSAGAGRQILTRRAAIARFTLIPPHNVPATSIDAQADPHQIQHRYCQ